ncbi:MAG TPA: branched-chain amino acid ABC transporter substrate-binding protein [Candidatus Dormibacteraeota bacterium]|nr:branched-chain amino acid ABC transporter substrate-binding protein [Candidatus Dormibacteraeota bacterium]
MGRLGSCVVAVALGLVCACAGSSPNTSSRSAIRIGVDLPLSGAEARAAAPALFGIRFYVQTHPQIDGLTVELRTADDAGDPSLGAANVRAFLTDPRLLAMLGPYDAAVARQEIPVANAAGLAMVSPATSNPCLTRDVFTPARLNPARTAITCKQAGLPGASDLRPDRTNNFFRLTTTDDLQGAAAAEYAFRKLHVLRAGVISDHEAYGQGLAYAFSARFNSLGGTVVGRYELDPKNPSASAFLQSAKEAGAQAIYYGGGTSGGGCGVRGEMSSMFSTGEATPFLGGDGIAEDPACISAAGQNGAGIFATVPIVDADSHPAAAATIRAFKAAFGSTADYGPYTLVAYDATAVLYYALNQAIQASGSGLPERSAVTTRVAMTDGLAGATGTLGFDSAGDTVNRVVSVFEATSADPRSAWKAVGAVDYSAKLPY